MFDVGASELLLIVIVAVVVIEPSVPPDEMRLNACGPARFCGTGLRYVHSFLWRIDRRS